MSSNTSRNTPGSLTHLQFGATAACLAISRRHEEITRALFDKMNTFEKDQYVLVSIIYVFRAYF